MNLLFPFMASLEQNSAVPLKHAGKAGSVLSFDTNVFVRTERAESMRIS